MNKNKIKKTLNVMKIYEKNNASFKDLMVNDKRMKKIMNDIEN